MANDLFEKTIRAYKLFRMDERRPGEVFPLFVNANDPVPFDEWLDAVEGPRSATGKVRSKLGELAFRPGWHAADLPLATHIGGGGQPPTFRRPTQVWGEVELPDEVDWQSAADEAGRNKRGIIVPARAAITDQVPFGGTYRFKTNPNMTGNWLISGNMRLKRLLEDAEVARLNAAAGLADLPRNEPLNLERFGLSDLAASALKGLKLASRSL